MKTITLRQLRKLGACHDQLAKFEQTFGKEVELTESLVVQYAGEFYVGWLFGKLYPEAFGKVTHSLVKVFNADTEEANQSYYEATAPALKVFKEATNMDADCQAYEEAEVKARKVYSEATAQAWKAWKKATAPAMKCYREAVAIAFYKEYTK